MRRTKRYQRLFCSSGLFLISACGPRYHTEYSFTPPDTTEGQRCVLQCENNKLQCAQLAQMRYTNCLQQADFNYQMCETRKRFRYDKKGRSKCIENCYCYRRSCREQNSHCDTAYRQCYEACGGTVETSTQCIANCDKIPQADNNSSVTQ